MSVGLAAGADVSSSERAIGDLLIQRGRLTPATLERALRVRISSEDERLPRLLTKLGLATERDVAEAVAQCLDLDLVGSSEFPSTPILEDKLGIRFLTEFRILPLAEESDAVILAMADPLDAYAINAVRLRTGRPVRPRVAVSAEIEAAIERLYGKRRDQTGAAAASGDDDDPGSLECDVERLKDLASEAPVIRIVNQMIFKAVESRASDIHIEPFEGRLDVRYRIDGALRETEPPPSRYRAAVVSRIKIMARLNIAERRLPQDGRIKMVVRGTPIDLRIAIAPTMHGESVVIRVLDRSTVALDFAALGIAGNELATYLSVLERPNGILLATGPTGSGKTTTLYTSLQRVHSPEKKTVTIEDPIEYQLEGINQIQVKPKIGLDFANILRSVLRHDPDIIMVGEIRDVETAQIAVQAALTGHLVLSTLHTNNAASSITRLLDMGVQDYLLTSTLNGAIAQRLVRTLCRKCRQPYQVMQEVVGQLGLRRYSQAREITLYRPLGCEECRGTGFFGRTSVFETLAVTDSIRRLILRHAESNELYRAAVQDGMQTMYDDGMRKTLAGITTIEEVLQVTRDVGEEGSEPMTQKGGTGEADLPAAAEIVPLVTHDRDKGGSEPSAALEDLLESIGGELRAVENR